MSKFLLLVFSIGVPIYCEFDLMLLKQQVNYYSQNEDDFENTAEYDAVHDIMSALYASGHCTTSNNILVGVNHRVTEK